MEDEGRRDLWNVVALGALFEALSVQTMRHPRLTIQHPEF